METQRRSYRLPSLFSTQRPLSSELPVVCRECWRTRWPLVTIRDQARLDIDRLHVALIDSW